jgi:hypothetical protein
VTQLDQLHAHAQARKLSGSEGFLIVFGRKDRDRYWWNLGGWGNSQHAIEFNQAPSAGLPADASKRSLVDNQSGIERRTNSLLSGWPSWCTDATAASSQKFFAVSGTDTATGDSDFKSNQHWR